MEGLVALHALKRSAKNEPARATDSREYLLHRQARSSDARFITEIYDAG